MDFESEGNTSVITDEKKINSLRKEYASFQKENPSEYVDFFAKKGEISLTIYKRNKKGKIKAVLQKASTHVALSKQAKPLWEKNNIKNLYPQIGSDEVGTGDFFGPVCVCAAFVKEEDLQKLEDLGITDSKKMDDGYILSIGPLLIKEFEYSQLSLPNEKYNEVRDDLNMNEIKAKMHNRCVSNLKNKHKDATIYQDQFAEEGLYYHYLNDEKTVARNIIFHTKGESLFPSVALASVIARYSFLRKMEALNKKYGLIFPFGAGEAINSFIPLFVDKFGINELKKVAKLNWANYRKFLENSNKLV